MSRNRQLSTFNSIGVGAKAAYNLKQVPGLYDLKGNVSYELLRFKFKDFTDLRTLQPYSHDAHVLQLFLSATF